MKDNIERSGIDIINTINEKGPDDLLVCCASFEERCIAILSKLADNFQTQFSLIFVIEEPLYSKEVEANLFKLQNGLSQKTTKRVFTILCQRQNPTDGLFQFKTIWEYINKFVDVKNLYTTIDISGITKIYLLELLHYLVFRLNVRMPRIIHTTQEYLPNKLTKGVVEVTTMPDYYGEPSVGKETLLLLFLGFEPERALTVWESFYPLKTIAILTNPPRGGNMKYLEYARKNNSYLLSRPSVEIKYAPSDDAIKIKQVLQDIFNTFKDSFNIIIGPFGTKSQVIGVFLFWLEHPEVQLVYSFPVEYTKSYLRREPGQTIIIPTE